MEIRLPKMEPWQRDVYDYATANPKGEVVVVKAKRQVGKSVLAGILLVWYSFWKNNQKNILVEPTLAQSRLVYTFITDLFDGTGMIKSSNATLLTIQFVNGSVIYFKSADQKDGLRGLSATGCLIIDEGAFIPNEVYDILFPVVDANNANLIIFSTPLFASGYFYELFTGCGSKTFDWADYDTSKFLSPEKLEQKRLTMPELRFKTEYLAQFIEEGGYVFTNIPVSTSTEIPAVCGIDWGTGNGEDYTWLTFLDSHGNSVRIWYSNQMKPTEQIGEIARLIVSSGVRKVQVEMNSIGQVYYDLLRRGLPSYVTIQRFNTTNDSKRRIIENLVEALNSGKCSVYDDTELRTQLQSYACEKLKTGYTYNAVNGQHDDGVMSLALAYDVLVNYSGGYCIGKPSVGKNAYKLERGRRRR